MKTRQATAPARHPARPRALPHAGRRAEPSASGGSHPAPDHPHRDAVPSAGGGAGRAAWSRAATVLNHDRRLWTLLCLLFSTLLIGGLGTQTHPSPLSASGPATQPGDSSASRKTGRADDDGGPKSRHVERSRQHATVASGPGAPPSGGQGTPAALAAPARPADVADARTAPPGSDTPSPVTGLLAAPLRAPPPRAV
ncbi:hypothetical protein [Thermostaphylospora chromogena]|uniref:Uncharacterized protein n=1 Tax=Thermostaphylospora chromogena TaxID=35622 RepID=A0A1H1BKG2_9ACTN|nr:hypothetical protein [Thermostaphylospora chromogena]SDQ52431.1 hypothetical protein SAMN04489764_1009 [Thermostaphylospora chromogena]